VWLKFRWHAESEDVSPQSDILLMMVADAVDRAFSALGSKLASVRPPPPDIPAAPQIYRDPPADISMPLSQKAR
jgi:hypothetical protein